MRGESRPPTILTRLVSRAARATRAVRLAAAALLPMPMDRMHVLYIYIYMPRLASAAPRAAATHDSALLDLGLGVWLMYRC